MSHLRARAKTTAFPQPAQRLQGEASLHIDRIVFSGLKLSASQLSLIQQALPRELARLGKQLAPSTHLPGESVHERPPIDLAISTTTEAHTLAAGIANCVMQSVVRRT